MPTQQQIKRIIVQELPVILQQDPEIKDLVLRLSRPYFADKKETESRFDQMLDELRRDREEQTKKWEAQEQRWKEHQREEKQRWAEYRIESNRRLEAIEKLSNKHDSTIDALGARWGIRSEATFRNALKGILERSFNVQVLNVTEYDERGEVFGHPDQVEMDIIIQDGQLIVCEIKSSMSKSDMYTFERKVRFYEKLHNRTADRMMVISPMLDRGAQAVADNLGIQVYSYADTVDPEIFD